MLLQLIESTYYFWRVYTRIFSFYYNEKEGRGKATKAMIRNKELGTYWLSVYALF